MARKTAPRKTSAAKRAAKKQAEVVATTRISVPTEVFQQLLAVLQELPYKHVGNVLNQVSATAEQIAVAEITDPASGDEATD